MAWIILLLFIGLPVLELTVLIDVGSEIGALSTIGLCFLSAAIGLSLVRMQGIRVFQNMQKATQTGDAIGENLIHGFFLLIAGVFLLIPGFITDFFGALLLLPFIRILLGRAGLAQMVVRTRKGGSVNVQADVTIIEGEFSERNASQRQDGVVIDQPVSTKRDTEKD